VKIDKLNEIIEKISSKFMPPLPSIGIELAANCIKVVFVKQESEGTASLLDYFILKFDKEDGYDEPATASKVKSLVEGMGLPQAVLSKFAISGAKVDSKRILLPFMPKEDIAQALRWQAKDYFLLNVDESMLDFEMLQEKISEDGTKSIEVIANIVDNGLINSKLEFGDKVFVNEFAPSVAMPVGYCLCNIYTLGNQDDIGNPIVLIDIGDSTTTIAVMKDKRVRLIRQIGVSGADFTKALTETLMSETGKIELSLDEAEALKQKVGIPGESTQQIEGNISTGQINSLLRPVVERLTNDIRTSLNYYASQFNEGKVGKLFISGGTSRLKNIDSHLSQKLSLPVELLKVPDRLNIELTDDKLEDLKQDFTLIAPAIGAALSNPEGMNLMPTAFRSQSIDRIKKISTRLIFTIAILVLSCFYMFDFGHERILKKILIAKQPQWQELQKIQELYLKIAQKNSIVNHTLKNQVPLYYIFKSISNFIPRDGYLRKMVINDDATNLQLEGVIIETGETGEVVIAEFIRALEDSDLFNNVLLSSTQDIKISRKQAMEFKISCKLGSRR